MGNSRRARRGAAAGRGSKQAYILELPNFICTVEPGGGDGDGGGGFVWAVFSAAAYRRRSLIAPRDLARFNRLRAQGRPGDFREAGPMPEAEVCGRLRRRDAARRTAGYAGGYLELHAVGGLVSPEGFRQEQAKTIKAQVDRLKDIPGRGPLAAAMPIVDGEEGDPIPLGEVVAGILSVRPGSAAERWLREQQAHLSVVSEHGLELANCSVERIVSLLLAAEGDAGPVAAAAAASDADAEADAGASVWRSAAWAARKELRSG